MSLGKCLQSRHFKICLKIQSLVQKGKEGVQKYVLVYSVVGRVEGTVVFEWTVLQGEKKSGRNPLIYGVFGDVHQEKWQHTVGDQ